MCLHKNQFYTRPEYNFGRPSWICHWRFTHIPFHSTQLDSTFSCRNADDVLRNLLTEPTQTALFFFYVDGNQSLLWMRSQDSSCRRTNERTSGTHSLIMNSFSSLMFSYKTNMHILLCIKWLFSATDCQVVKSFRHRPTAFLLGFGLIWPLLLLNKSHKKNYIIKCWCNVKLLVRAIVAIVMRTSNVPLCFWWAHFGSTSFIYNKYGRDILCCAVAQAID